MKEGRYRLIDKENLCHRDDWGGSASARDLWLLRLDAPDIDALPGSFVDIAVEGHYLRRPISVSEYEDGVLSLIVQAVGDGTRRIVATRPGESLAMLTGLGRPFTVANAADLGLPRPGGRDVVLLIGGGAGYAPLVGLMKRLRTETDLHPFAVFGFNGEADVPLRHIARLRDEGFPVEYSTMTGEMGDHGNALEVALEYVDHFDLNPVFFYTCGPMPMMRAVCDSIDTDGELSLEARMGCGFGACMGCTIPTAEGPRRICKDGPVFRKSQLL